MHIFSAGIITETNSFSPIPISYSAFEDAGIYRGAHPPSVMGSSITNALKKRGLKVTEGLLTSAEPGGPVAREAYESLRDELLDDLRRSLPVDGVLLMMHGGMIAYGYEDCEGDLIKSVRELVGSEVFIGALFDPHAHLSDEMIDNANILCFYKENPHTDITSRAEDLVDITVKAIDGKVSPVMSVFDCKLADVFQTNREPMQSFVDKIRSLESESDILDISPVHCFRRGDCSSLGTKMIVTTDNNAQLGSQLAEQLGMELFEMRGKGAEPVMSMKEALALARERIEWPIVFADMADNPGGGSPGDSTYIINDLFDNNIDNFAAGAFVDPMAIQMANEAGEGAELNLRIGGKSCRFSGEPVDLDVKVEKIIKHYVMSFDEYNIDMGDTVYLSSNNIDLVLCTKRVQTFSPAIFTDLGVNLANKKYIVVKSAQHYRAWFKEYLKKDFVVADRGVCIENWTSYPFQNVRKDIWPFIENPFEAK